MIRGTAEMSARQSRSIATILGVKSRGARPVTALELADAVGKGLPVEAVDRLCGLVAPTDPGLRYRIVSKATLARRQRTPPQRLSPEESDRVARLARVWSLATEVWGSDAAAQRFLAEPHPLLDGRVPREVATATDIGARAV